MMSPNQAKSDSRLFFTRLIGFARHRTGLFSWRTAKCLCQLAGTVSADNRGSWTVERLGKAVFHRHMTRQP
jgi:hypothetical protein